MNILPLVMTALLLFAFLSSTLQKEAQSTYIEKISYLGFMEAERKARSEVASRAYKNARHRSYKPSKTTIKDKSCINRRKRIYLTERSKLNISSLFAKKS